VKKSKSPLDWHRRYQQQAGWTRQARQFLAKQVNFAHAQRILDVGCGTGALFPDLQRASSAQIDGIDISLESLKRAKRLNPQVNATCGSTYHLPYPNESFDIVLCHFLLLWLSDPLRGLAEMRRVTRTGGFLCLLAEPDYGGRIDYPAAFEKVGRLQIESLQAQGADPVIGRKLRSLLSQTGLQKIQVNVIGGHWSGTPDLQDRKIEWAVLEEDLQGRLPAGELNDLRQLDAAAWENGERILYVPTFYAWGSK
jgi:ubiquinone/menaquinone biosynthesis C-methylase UbiE